jgi:hypothetical protein
MRTAIVFAALAFAVPAIAADPMQNLVNNFSHENAICGAYNLFVSQCLKNKDQNDKLASDYFTVGDNLIKRSLEMGRSAGLSEKALSARVDLAIEDLKSDTENNCINIAVLYKKHAQTCKSLYEDGPRKLLDNINKLGPK